MTSVVAEYGTISMSSPMLVTIDKASPFEFDLPRTAEQYFNSAKTESSVVSRTAFSSESLFKLALALKMSEAGGIMNERALEAFDIQDQATADERADQATLRADRAAARDALIVAADSKLKADLLAAGEDPAKQATAYKAHADALSAIAGPPPAPNKLYQSRIQAADAELASELKAAEALTEEPKKLEAIAAARRKHATLLAAAEQSAASPTALSPTLTDQTASAQLPGDPDDAISFRSNDGKGPLTGIQGASVPDASAIVTAAGNVTREGIFSILGNPYKYSKFADKKVLVGVSMVSVDPGYATHQDYRADVSCRVRYIYKPARAELVQLLLDKHTAPPKSPSGNSTTEEALAKTDAFPPELIVELKQYLSVAKAEKEVTQQKAKSLNVPNNIPFITKTRVGVADHSQPDGPASVEGIPEPYAVPDGAAPLVAAVSPFTDVETLDLSQQYSQRKAFAMDIRFALEALGYGGDLEAITTYSENLDRDAAQRRPLAAVTSYSNAGGLFGYSIVPRPGLKADPTNSQQAKARTSTELRRESFPTLIVVAMDQDDVQIKFGRNAAGQIIPYEPVLAFEQTSRWLPLQRKVRGKRISEVELALLSVSGQRTAEFMPSEDWLSAQAGIDQLEQAGDWAKRLRELNAAISNSKSVIEKLKQEIKDQSNQINAPTEEEGQPQDQQRRQSRDDAASRLALELMLKKQASDKAKEQLDQDVPKRAEPARVLARIAEVLDGTTTRQLVAARQIDYTVWREGLKSIKALIKDESTDPEGKSTDPEGKSADPEGKSADPEGGSADPKHPANVTALVDQALKPLRAKLSGVQVVDGLDAIRQREEAIEFALLGSVNYQAIPLSYFGYEAREAKKEKQEKPAIQSIIPTAISHQGGTISLVGVNLPEASKEGAPGYLIEVMPSGAGTIEANSVARISGNLLQFKLNASENPTRAVVFKITLPKVGEADAVVLTSPPLIIAAPPTVNAPASVTRTVTDGGVTNSESITASNPALIEKIIDRDKPAPAPEANKGDTANINIEVDAESNAPTP